MSPVWLAALFGATIVLLVPALWNGFPFMFYDSGAFIEQAVHGRFVAERSVFYAWFLKAFWPTVSLWPAIVAQAAMTVLVMAAFARGLAPRLTAGTFFALVVALSLATGLPWNAAEVLPDILAPLLVLCLYLLGFHAASLGRARKAALIAVAVFATTAHASHLGLAAGLAVTVALLQWATRRVAPSAAAPRWRLPALVFGLSLGLVVAANVARTGEWFVTRAGPSFVFGRLLQDGIVQRVLDETCPQSGYRLCAYKDILPKDANDWLWGRESPFRQLGEFAGTDAESRAIVAVALKRYPLLNLKMAILNTAEQFVSIETGDGIEPLSGVPDPILERHAPRLLDDYRAARQQGQIPFRWINRLQVPLGAASIAALAGLLAAAVRKRQWDDRAFLPVFLLLALVGNAFICGVLSNPQDRYQSRLIWAAVFAVPLLIARRPRSVRPRLSGAYGAGAIAWLWAVAA